MRAGLFLAMIGISSFQVMIKCLLVVVVEYMFVGWSWLYLGGDMAVYIMLKLARGDFTYWLPIKGVLGFLVSLFVRLIVRIVADFTSCVHLRHPSEVGGLYFTVNIIVPLIGLIPFLLLEKGTFLEKTETDLVQLTKVFGGGLFCSISIFSH